MAEYQGCDNCKHDNTRTYEFPCNACIHNKIASLDHWKPMTNADRIRNMSDEELAEFLVKVNSTIQDCMVIDCKCENTDRDCKDCFLEWLQAEVKEGGEDERS